MGLFLCMSTISGAVQALQLWSFALTLTVLMKRIKQEKGAAALAFIFVQQLLLVGHEGFEPPLERL